MSERGVFAVDRGIFDHPEFKPEPYTEREAWLWLCGEAAFREKKVRVSGRTITLSRGQLIHSERFLATKWKWSKSSVHRFLGRLKSGAMLDLTTDHETNLITICNYEKYAFGRTRSGPRTEPQSGPVMDQLWTKEEEGKKERKNDAPSAPLLGQPTEEAELYRRGKEVLGRNAGGLISKLLKVKHGSVALARAAIEQASTKHSPAEYIGRVVSGPAASGDDFYNPMAGIL